MGAGVVVACGSGATWIAGVDADRSGITDQTRRAAAAAVAAVIGASQRTAGPRHHRAWTAAGSTALRAIAARKA
jgi:hypothetical protein